MENPTTKPGAVTLKMIEDLYVSLLNRPWAPHYDFTWVCRTCGRGGLAVHCYVPAITSWHAEQQNCAKPEIVVW